MVKLRLILGGRSDAAARPDDSLDGLLTAAELVEIDADLAATEKAIAAEAAERALPVKPRRWGTHLPSWAPGPPKGGEYHYNLALQREAEAYGHYLRQWVKQRRAEDAAKAAARDPDSDSPAPRE